VGGHGQIAARLEAALGQDPRALGRDVAEGQGHVGHHVPDEVGALAQALAREVRHRGLGGAQQQVGGVVCEHAVQLLGHRAVEGAHARLDVPDGDMGLGGRQRARERGVRVPVHQHEPGGQLGQQRLESGQHARRLLGGGAAAGAKLAVRRRHAELLEEDPR